jgi:hypothetical protein
MAALCLPPLRSGGPEPTTYPPINFFYLHFHNSIRTELDLLSQSVLLLEPSAEQDLSKLLTHLKQRYQFLEQVYKYHSSVEDEVSTLVASSCCVYLTASSAGCVPSVGGQSAQCHQRLHRRAPGRGAARLAAALTSTPPEIANVDTPASSCCTHQLAACSLQLCHLAPVRLQEHLFEQLSQLLSAALSQDAHVREATIRCAAGIHAVAGQPLYQLG